MRTEQSADGIDIIADTDRDVTRLDTLMNGTQNVALFRFLDLTLHGDEVSGIFHPHDDNNHPDMVSKYMNWFVLTPFSPALRPRGMAIAILYLHASPSLRHRLDAMLETPARAAHKAYITESTSVIAEPVNVYPAVAARRTTFRD